MLIPGYHGSGPGFAIYVAFGIGVGAVAGSVLVAISPVSFSENLLYFVTTGGVIGGLLGGLLGSTPQTNTRRSISLGTTSHFKRQNMVEVASAVVVILTFIGLVLGIIVPGRLTGAVFPLAVAAWFILYRMIEQKK